MTDQKVELSSPPLIKPMVAPDWETIFANRQLIAADLARLESDLPEARHQIRLLRRWFEGVEERDGALARPDVLSFCIALDSNGGLKAKSDSSSSAAISTDGLGHAVRNAFCSLGKDTASSRHLLSQLLYPVLALATFCFLVVGFSLFISPIFQNMFAEFGIELPALTQWVFSVTSLIQRVWWLTIVVPLALFISIWAISRMTANSRPGNLNFIDQKILGDRTVLANWSWHLSHLLKVGFEEPEAALIAGRSSGKSWVYQLSKNWEAAASLRGDSVPPVIGEPTNDASAEEVTTFYPAQRFSFLNSVMALPNSPAKIEMLKEVAYYYWDRTGNSSGWWIYWVNLFIFGAIVFSVVIGVLSLFMPLIAIVSGLTSYK
ncbi:MAG: hypothetical protein AB8B55_00705 [Mariniblastus sp.]